MQGHPCWLSVKNPPLNAGDRGLIPDLGRSHISVVEQVSSTACVRLNYGAWQLQLLSPRAATSEAPVP